MGGNSRQKKSSSNNNSFSLFSFFKSRRPNKKVYDQETWDEATIATSSRIWASDEDRGRWVAEPGIDKKASAFIARFHENRVSESERQYYQSSGNA